MKITFSTQVLRAVFTVLLLGSACSIRAQDKPFLKHASIYLVRHAEKEAGNDPALTVAGQSRAGHLVAALDGNVLHKVFVTQYKRTQQTADSLRVQVKVDTVHYMADANGDGLMRSLQKHRIKNEKVLIIGHSNTIPIIIGRLGISKPVTISDNEYNTIFLIKYVKGEPLLFKKKFGNPMLQAENTGWEEVL